MAEAALIATAASSLLSVGTQIRGGKVAQREAELTAEMQETAAVQREADRKERLAEALATANARAGASGIRAFEGSPLTILQKSIEQEETATERDQFNTRISALMSRARGRSALAQSQLGAATSLLKGASSTAQLIPEA